MFSEDAVSNPRRPPSGKETTCGWWPISLLLLLGRSDGGRSPAADGSIMGLDIGAATEEASPDLLVLILNCEVDPRLPLSSPSSPSSTLALPIWTCSRAAAFHEPEPSDPSDIPPGMVVSSGNDTGGAPSWSFKDLRVSDSLLLEVEAKSCLLAVEG